MVALLVVGQGLVRTGALDHLVRRMIVLRRHHPAGAVAVTLLAVLVLSGVLNNTPVVVIFIPIMTALAERLSWSVSGVMMPLSFAAILGGMTTLIGSSTNLLVASTAINLGQDPIGFFDFTVPGLVLAAVGLVYTVAVVPRILPDRASPVLALIEGHGKQYLTQIAVAPGSALVGQTTAAGMFPARPDMTVRLIRMRSYSRSMASC